MVRTCRSSRIHSAGQSGFISLPTPSWSGHAEARRIGYTLPAGLVSSGPYASLTQHSLTHFLTHIARSFTPTSRRIQPSQPPKLFFTHAGQATGNVQAARDMRIHSVFPARVVLKPENDACRTSFSCKQPLFYVILATCFCLPNQLCNFLVLVFVFVPKKSLAISPERQG